MPLNGFGRSVTLLMIVTAVALVLAWWFRPGWHLTLRQRWGMAEVAKNIPKDTIVLIELPQNNTAGRGYGEELMDVLKENGVNVNSITVFYGTRPTPAGLVVSARYRSDPSYPTATYVHYKMIMLDMPASFEENNTGGGTEGLSNLCRQPSTGD